MTFAKSTLCRTYFKCIRRHLDSTFALGLRSFWKFHVAVVRNNGKRNIQKSVVHVQSFFANYTYCCTVFRRCMPSPLMHPSIPPAPSRPPPRVDPLALAFFLPWVANSRGWGLLSCQIPRGGDEKRGQMPRPPSTLQHFS